MDNEMALYKIAMEGAYAFDGYASGSELEDPKAGELWDQAGDAYRKLVAYLENATGQSVSDF